MISNPLFQKYITTSFKYYRNLYLKGIFMKQRITFSALFVLLFATFVLGGVWQREVVDSSANSTGAYCSLALDSNNQPHITYCDYDNFDLHYAYQENGVWHTSMVDSIGYAGIHCSLVLDANNRPHIAYQKGYYIMGVTDVGLKYATLTDTGWARFYVDSTRFGTVELFSSIAIRSDGTIGISYIDTENKRVKFAYKTGDTWHLVDVDTADAVAGVGFCKLVFKSDGTPVIGYSADYLKIATLNANDSTWNTVNMPNQYFTLEPSAEINMDIDSQDNIHLTYLSISFNFQHAIYDWQSWQEETVYAGIVRNASLKIDKNNRPNIIIADNDVILYTKENNQWTQTLIDDDISEKSFSSLQFDSFNYAHLAFQGKLSYSNVEASLIYYRYWPGSPQIALPVTSHDFGAVWTQSYGDWDCPVTNTGQGPLIITNLDFQSAQNSFQIINTPLPIYVQPLDTAYLGIRFQPQLQQTYQTNLNIHSNDSLNPVASVSLTGQGTSSGSTGDLTLTIKNGYYDQTNGFLKNDIPWDDGEVRIFQNSQMVSGPHITTATGVLNLNALPIGDLQIRMQKDILLPDGVTQEHINMNKNVEIGPGANSHTLVFPESLIVYKFELIHELTHIENEYFGVPANYTYGNSESQIKALLKSWNSNFTDEEAENLARLILVEKMVYDMWDSATSAGNESIRDLGDLIGFIFFSDGWQFSIIQLLLSILESVENPSEFMYALLNFFIKEMIRQAIIQGVSYAIDQVSVLLPDPGPEIIQTGWNQVKAHYSGILGGTMFGSAGWNAARSAVFQILEYPFYQSIYIDLMSSSTLDEANTYSQNFNYTGDFHDAHLEKSGFVSDKKRVTEQLVSLSSGFRLSANLFMVTSNIFQWLGSIVPGFMGQILQQVSYYSKISAYINVVTALGFATGGFFALPIEMKDEVDDIYLVGDKTIPNRLLSRAVYPRSKLSDGQLASIKNNLYQSVSSYDSMISDIKQNLQGGNSIQAAAELQDLWQTETALNNNFQLASAPIYSVAHEAQDSISSFTEMYDSLRNYCAYGVEKRLMNYIYVAGAAIDSSQEVLDSVYAQLDRSVQMNHQFADQISTTLDTVTTHFEIPAVVMVSYTHQEKLRLNKDETSTVSVKVKNVGSLPADNLSIVLQTNDALSINDQDSIYIGSLDPGEESSIYSWTVSIFNDQISLATWDAYVHSSNAKTYSASGSFSIVQPESPGTGGKLSNENIYNYPNPFNPDNETTTLRYSLEKSAQVTIKIFDSGGNLVKTLLDNDRQTAGMEQAIPWDGKNGDGTIVANGVYFFTIESSREERAVGKIAVLR
jgi:hypothetical protein